MRTRRSARVRAANALRTSTTVNEPQDENSLQQTRKQVATGKSAASGKENVRLRKDRSQTKTPLRDVTNNAPTTRSRHPPNTVDVPSKPNGDEREVINDAVISSAQDKRNTRRKRPRSKPSTARKESRSATYPSAETKLADAIESSAQDIQPDAGRSSPDSRHSNDSNKAAPASPPKYKQATHEDIETELETRSNDLSTEEIQPNPPKTDSQEGDRDSEPNVDEIQPNSPAKTRRVPSLLLQTSDEIQRGPAKNLTPSAESPAGSGLIRASSPMVHDSPPLSPLPTKLASETHQASWVTVNRESNGADLDTTRPRQAVYTYGKRRRIARVSLPTMQALGVRAQSPSSDSQSGSGNDGDDNLSDAYAESEDENEKSPKRNPKLQAFVMEQKKLWQEVDEIDLLVESD